MKVLKSGKSFLSQPMGVALIPCCLSSHAVLDLTVVCKVLRIRFISVDLLANVCCDCNDRKRNGKAISAH